MKEKNKNPLDFVVGIDEDFSAALLGCIANGYNILIKGRHGTAKSMLATAIGECFTNSRIYHADKENLLSIVGIPNPKKMAEGKFEYVAHERSIFKAGFVFIDEVTRASYETQNLFLEVLQERAINGMPLDKLKAVVGCANPQSYAACQDLDQAFLDRFYCVIHIPENQDCSDYTETIKQINECEVKIDSKKIKKFLSDIPKQKTPLKENVYRYLGNIAKLIRKSVRVIDNEVDNISYVSPRAYAKQAFQLVNAMTQAYQCMGVSYDNAITNAGENAVRYIYCNKANIPAEAVETAISNSKTLLSAPEEFKERIDFNSSTFQELITKISKNYSVFNKLPPSEQARYINDDVVKDLEHDDTIPNKKDILHFYLAITEKDKDNPSLRKPKDFLDENGNGTWSRTLYMTTLVKKEGYEINDLNNPEDITLSMGLKYKDSYNV